MVRAGEVKWHVGHPVDAGDGGREKDVSGLVEAVGRLSRLERVDGRAEDEEEGVDEAGHKAVVDAGADKRALARGLAHDLGEGAI